MNIHPVSQPTSPTEFDVLCHVADAASALAGRVLAPHITAAIAAAAAAALVPTSAAARTFNP